MQEKSINNISINIKFNNSLYTIRILDSNCFQVIHSAQTTLCIKHGNVIIGNVSNSIKAYALSYINYLLSDESGN